MKYLDDIKNELTFVEKIILKMFPKYTEKIYNIARKQIINKIIK